MSKIALRSTFAPLPATERGFGKHLATHTDAKKGTRIAYGIGRNVIVRNLENPTECLVYSEHKANVNCARFSPSGNFMASGDQEGKCNIWEIDFKKTKISVPVCQNVTDVCWDAENKRVAAVGMGGAQSFAKVFSFDMGTQLGVVGNHTQKILSVDYKPTRPYRLVTSSEDNAVNFHEGPPFKFFKAFLEHKGYPNTVRFSPDGNFCASVGSDTKIFLFDAKEGTKVKELEHKDGHSKCSIYDFAWSPDSKQIATASSDKTVKVWDVEKSEVTATCKVADKPETDDMQMATAWVGKFLVSLSLSGAINYHDPANPSKPVRVIRGHNKLITALAVDASNGNFYTADQAGWITEWDSKTGDATWFEGKKDGKCVNCLQVSGGTLLSAGFDDKLRSHDIKARKIATDGSALGGQPVDNGMARGTKDPSLTVVAMGRGILAVCKDGKVATSLQVSYTPTCIAMSADDARVVVGGKDRKSRVYSLSDSKLTETRVLDGEEHQSAIERVAFSPCGTWINTVGAQKISFWDKDGKQHNSHGWGVHTASTEIALWSPNGKLFATAGLDGALYIWNNFTDFLKASHIKIDDTHLMGMSHLGWLSDSSLVSVGRDMTIRIWDIKE